MNTKELIRELQKYPPEREVKIKKEKTNHNDDVVCVESLGTYPVIVVKE